MQYSPAIAHNFLVNGDQLPLVAINNGCLAELSSTGVNNADRTLSEPLLLLRNAALPENTTSAAATG